MQYTTLGRTGIRVSRMCLGSVPFGKQLDEAASHRVLDRALDLGINFIDTADIYEGGRTEEVIGSWLEGKRQQVVLASKVRGRTGDGQNDTGLSRLHIMQAVEASLKRLRTDHLDLYQVHAVDPSTPIETTLRALDDLVRQGKVVAVGCSNYLGWELCKALWTSDLKGFVRFESVQNRYNVLAREIEPELVPLCSSEQVAVLPYNPLAGGLLTGKYRYGEPIPEGSRFDFSAKLYTKRYWYEQTLQAVDRLKPIAASTGLTLAQYALAWVLGNPAVTSAIVGASSTSQLDETVKAIDRPLTQEERDAGSEAAVGAVVGPCVGPREQ